VRRGCIQVMEGRHCFGHLTVEENLQTGAYTRSGAAAVIRRDLDMVYTYFPRLKERRLSLAGYISGGEQQMVAIGRALMSRPRLLLMDEPSMGLSPVLVQQNFEILKQVNDTGVAMLMVEQNANMALSIADRGYVLATGELVLADTAANLLASEDLKRAYLGH
jgi:branched-chain amino acid transport system ATP-binding protein